MLLVINQNLMNTSIIWSGAVWKYLVATWSFSFLHRTASKLEISILWPIAIDTVYYGQWPLTQRHHHRRNDKTDIDMFAAKNADFPLRILVKTQKEEKEIKSSSLYVKMKISTTVCHHRLFKWCNKQLKDLMHTFVKSPKSCEETAAGRVAVVSVNRVNLWIEWSPNWSSTTHPNSAGWHFGQSFQWSNDLLWRRGGSDIETSANILSLTMSHIDFPVQTQ